RLRLDGNVLCGITILLCLRANRAETVPALFALCLEADTRVLELGHRFQAFLQAGAGFGDRFGLGLMIGVDLLDLAGDAADALGSLFDLGTQRADLRAELTVRTMQPVDLALQFIAALFERAHALAGFGELRLNGFALL